MQFTRETVRTEVLAILKTHAQAGASVQDSSPQGCWICSAIEGGSPRCETSRKGWVSDWRIRNQPISAWVTRVAPSRMRSNSRVWSVIEVTALPMAKMVVSSRTRA